jgi:hypothetical protein
MAQQNLNPTIRSLVNDQLVDENVEAAMAAAVARRADVVAIRWLKRPNEYWLYTPYGKLEIHRSFSAFWRVQRDDAPLVHARSPRDALFTSLPAAKLAGLLHVMDGFANKAPYNDGLWWNIHHSRLRQPVLQTPAVFQANPSISDDHEWGLQQLGSLLKKSSMAALPPDGNLVLDMERAARRWELPAPAWTKQAHGYYELNTPYGLLLVRRLIGWTVERNSMPLVWFWGGDPKVIFDKLEHAKTSALLHAGECGDMYVGDGTRWDRGNQQKHLPNVVLPKQSGAMGNNHGVA